MVKASKMGKSVKESLINKLKDSNPFALLNGEEIEDWNFVKS